MPRISDSQMMQEKISSNFVSFQEFLGTAERFFRGRKWDIAAVYAQIAADHAVWNHAGIWTSPKMEEMLLAIGRQLKPDRIGKTSARKDSRPRVLHVLTEAYGIGGHTRLVWRWIQEDRTRSHSVALTRQGGTPMPQALIDAVRSSGGDVAFLDKKMGGLLARARALRELSVGFDYVVLHVHPYDVVPVIAFAEKQDCPPVILLNHADHLFWVGVSVSDVVAHIRDSGLKLSRERRGIEEDRCVILPIPVNLPNRQLAPAQARKQLGLRENAVVLLTIAAPFKYEPIFRETSFIDAVLPTLNQNEKLVLLVVGPKPSGQWERGVRESNGKIRVYGKREDTEIFYQAADIYLDSFPAASLTSMLEAAGYEVPLVAFSPFREEAGVLAADSPGFADTLIAPKTIESYRAEISRLAENAELRIQLGKETRQCIARVHASPNWTRFLENTYDCASRIPRVRFGAGMTEESRTEYVDVRSAALNKDPGRDHGLDEVLWSHLGLLPLSVRLQLWAGTFHNRHRALPRCLLSEWSRTSVRRWISGQVNP